MKAKRHKTSLNSKDNAKMYKYFKLQITNCLKTPITKH